MMEIEHLPGLCHRAEERMAAARAFALRVEAHGRGLRHPCGRNHRAVEIQRQARRARLLEALVCGGTGTIVSRTGTSRDQLTLTAAPGAIRHDPDYRTAFTMRALPTHVTPCHGISNRLACTALTETDVGDQYGRQDPAVRMPGGCEGQPSDRGRRLGTAYGRGRSLLRHPIPPHPDQPGRPGTALFLPGCPEPGGAEVLQRLDAGCILHVRQPAHREPDSDLESGGAADEGGDDGRGDTKSSDGPKACPWGRLPSSTPVVPPPLRPPIERQPPMNATEAIQSPREAANAISPSSARGYLGAARSATSAGGAGKRAASKYPVRTFSTMAFTGWSR